MNVWINKMKPYNYLVTVFWRKKSVILTGKYEWGNKYFLYLLIYLKDFDSNKKKNKKDHRPHWDQVKIS